MLRRFQLLAAVGGVLAAGCAGTGAPGPEGVAPGTMPGAPQVMVMLAPAPAALWAQTAGQLANTYRLRTVYAWTLGSVGEHCVVYEVTGGRTADELVRRMASDPLVESVQGIESYEVLAEAPTNDPYAHLQHSSDTLRLRQAHRFATGKGVRVAVIDTGVDLDHPDLRGRIVKAQNFVDRGERSFTTDFHGTAMAGVIAAGANNEVGIVGVAPQAELYALKACWQQPPGARAAVCNSYTLAKALDFAIVEKAQVLNFSLAGPPDPLLARLIKVALDRGIAVIAAAPPSGDASRAFPATLQGVIGIVGNGAPPPPAGAPQPRPAYLAAPAVDVLTTVPRGSYDFFSGSSMAAAQVSGVAALLLERNPKLTPAQIAAVFRETARRSDAADGGGPQAPAEIDACAALASAAGIGPCS
ncbi:MAG TPA: S8 family serine peptidase [Thermoanaerobaculia bacterium]|nr:S8 family serine peptidase [Thermoanaerobaculia bacterium]